MKLLCASLLLLVSSSFLTADEEPKAPVFTLSYSSSSPKVGDIVEVIFKADVPQGFHMYSTYNKCDIGPLKLDIQFTKHASYKLVGTPYSVGDKKAVDEVFKCEVGQFDKVAEVRQKIKVISKDVVIKGSIEGQWCTETTCYSFGGLVPITFSSQLKVSAAASKPAAKTSGQKTK